MSPTRRAPAKRRSPQLELPGPTALVRTIATARDRAPRHELALDLGPERGFISLCVSRDDKEALDAVQAWYSFRMGRRVPHWELFNLILAEALGNERGRFFRMAERSWV